MPDAKPAASGRPVRLVRSPSRRRTRSTMISWPFQFPFQLRHVVTSRQISRAFECALELAHGPLPLTDRLEHDRRVKMDLGDTRVLLGRAGEKPDRFRVVSEKMLHPGEGVEDRRDAGRQVIRAL